MGFSQEIKDFLVGFNTTSDFAMKTQSAALDRQRAKDDKAYKDANLELEQQRFGLQKSAQGLRDKLAMASGARAQSASARAAARLEMQMKEKEAKALGVLGDDPEGNFDTGMADEEAAAAAEADAQQYFTPDDFGGGTSDETASFARGGLVQTAADGAMVGAIPDEDAIIQRKVRAAQGASPAAIPVAPPVTPPSNPPTAAAAIPAAPAATPATVVPAGAPVPRSREERNMVYAKAGEATELAMRSLKQDAAGSSQPEEALPTVAVAKSEFDPATNKGAATSEEIKAIDSKIGGSFDGYTKGAARLAYAYNYFMENGEIEKAANVAKRILLFDKQAAQTRGYLAQKALEQGDTAAAAKLISDAYNENIPDGQELKTTLNPDGSVSYTVLKDGEVVDEGSANTEQLWAMAAKVKDGSEFLSRMARLAQTYSPMGSNGAFGKAQTAFVEANAEFLALQEKYTGASEAEKRTLYGDLKKADKARRAAWQEAQQVGSKYVKGKNEAEVYKTINESLKAAVATFGGKSAGPAPAAAPEGDVNALGRQYAKINTEIAQINEQLDISENPNGPEYNALKARLQPLVALRDQVVAQFEKAAKQSMSGKNEVEVATSIAEALKTLGGSPAALPMDFSAKSWKAPGGTLPQTAADVEKETELQRRVAAGEQITFKPLPDTDIARVVDAVISKNKDPDALVGRLIRDGFDPTGVATALKQKGVSLSIDISGITGTE